MKDWVRVCYITWIYVYKDYKPKPCTLRTLIGTIILSSVLTKVTYILMEAMVGG